MADKGIIFSGPMVRALLAGRKSQTRRLLKGVPEAPSIDNVVHPNPKHPAPYFDAYCGGKKTEANPRGMTDQWCWWTRDDRCGHGCKVPYVPGDRLYVRESIRCFADSCDDAEIAYLADDRRWQTGPCTGQVPDAGLASYFKLVDRAKKNARRVASSPSIHMPRWASRLTLTVTEVRVQRLQEISEDDAIAEGLVEYELEGPGGLTVPCWHWLPGMDDEKLYNFPISAYRALWNSLHTKPGERWEDDPWVVAVSFDVHRCNIDALVVQHAGEAR